MKTNGQYASRFKQLRKELAPTCSKCHSDDVSYGGMAVNFAFQTSLTGRVTSGLLSAALLFTVAVFGWPFVTLVNEGFYPLNTTLFFAAIAGLLGARGLSLYAFKRFRSALDNPEDVRWVCEKCSFDWVASEAPQSGSQPQPA